MKKITKISLLTSFSLLSLTTNVFAQNSLADAFSNGKLKGQLKTYYFAQNFEDSSKNDSSIWVNGGNLNYITDSFNGLKFGATFQTSHVASIDDKDSKTKKTMDASGSVLSESYVDYKLKNTEFKLGRQYISLPLLNGSSSRIIKESFEGYFISNTDIPDTLISLGKVTKFQGRTDLDGNVGKFEDIGEKGLVSFFVNNKSIKNLNLRLHYTNTRDEVAALYADAKYKFNSSYKPYVAVQYYNTNYDSAAKKDNSLYGLKTGISLSNLNLFTGFTKAGGKEGEDKVYKGIGGKVASFTNAGKTSTPAYEAGTKTWQVGVAYKIASLKSKLRYSQFDNPAENKDLNQTNLNLVYKFSGKFKNLKAHLDFSILDYENDSKDATDLRTKLIYSF